MFSMAAPLPVEGAAPAPGGLEGLFSGGFPPGCVAELSGAPSSGKASLALARCLKLLARGEGVAWVDAGAGFWPLPALEAGLPLEELLVVRVRSGDAALHAAHLLLGCPGAVALVVVDVPGAFRPSNPQLVKLQRLAERAASGLLFLTERPADAPSLGAVVSLRLHVRREPSPQEAVKVEVLRHKRGATQQHLEEPLHGPDRLRVRSTL